MNPLPDLAVSGVSSSGFEKFQKMTNFHIFKEKFLRLILTCLFETHVQITSRYKPSMDQKSFDEDCLVKMSESPELTKGHLCSNLNGHFLASPGFA